MVYVYFNNNKATGLVSKMFNLMEKNVAYIQILRGHLKEWYLDPYPISYSIDTMPLTIIYNLLCGPVNSIHLIVTIIS